MTVETRRIAVMGATGSPENQGRGVINSLMFNKGSVHYEVRPLTRSLSGKLADAFRHDFPQLTLSRWSQDDIESLKLCFEGCYGVFIITACPLVPGMTLKEWTRDEFALAERCLEAANAAKVSHIVYPTLPSIFNATAGRFNIRHFETRYQVSRLIAACPIPSTILYPGPSYTNFLDLPYTYWDGDTVIFSTPASADQRMSWTDPGHDIGWFARAVFDKGTEQMNGREIPVCGQRISYAELASKVRAVMGIKAEYRQCSSQDFEARCKSYSGIARDEIGLLGEWLAVAPDERMCFGTMDIESMGPIEKELGVNALSWEKFLDRIRWRGPPRTSVLEKE